MNILKDNQTAYIIGGGPSLSKFDFEKLRGLPCYGANKSALAAPWGHLISIDSSFIENSVQTIHRFGDRAHLAPIERLQGDIPSARYYRRTKGRDLFESRPDELPGLNSGFAAFAKAVRDGFTRIALLGFDMNYEWGHFHSGYQWSLGVQSKGTISLWIEDLEQAAHECRRRGLTVVNFSPNSAIQGFPKRSLDTIVGNGVMIEQSEE